MQTAPIPSFEKERLCALEGLNLLDTATEERFDVITRKAISRFNVPISTITLVDKDREWFKSVQGLEKKEGPRDVSFCGHALMSEVLLIIEDTWPVFRANAASSNSFTIWPLDINPK